MGTVVELFKPRAQAPAPAARVAAPVQERDHGPAIHANAQMLAAAGIEGLNELEQQGTAMKVLAALLFYAHQGQDQGRRARSAVVAMQELLGQPPAAA